jgi:hypothetical protein
MPANFTTLPHFSVSSAISFPNSAGFELLRLEVARLGLHDVRGQLQHVLGNFFVRNILEVFVLFANLVGIAQRNPKEALTGLTGDLEARAWALYAESEDAGCMVGLQAAELPSVDETAITDTATSPPKPKNSAFNSGC